MSVDYINKFTKLWDNFPFWHHFLFSIIIYLSHFLIISIYSINNSDNVSFFLFIMVIIIIYHGTMHRFLGKKYQKKKGRKKKNRRLKNHIIQIKSAAYLQISTIYLMYSSVNFHCSPIFCHQNSKFKWG